VFCYNGPSQFSGKRKYTRACTLGEYHWRVRDNHKQFFYPTLQTNFSIYFTVLKTVIILFVFMPVTLRETISF
jgi:hypothetical protein